MNTDIAIDIETLRDITPSQELAFVEKVEPDRRLKDLSKIKADLDAKVTKARDKAALSPLTGSVCCVVCQEVDTAAKPFSVCGPDEAALLSSLCEYLAQYDMPIRLVTFNGRHFDMPYLVARCALRGVESVWRWPVGYSPYLVDLRDVLTEGSLDMWADRFFGVCKEHLGSEVQSLWDAGHADVVLAHCMEDVDLTARIWKRIRCQIDERRK